MAAAVWSTFGAVVRLLLAVVALVAVVVLPAAAQGLVSIPALTARVIDTTQTLSDSEKQALEQKLAGFEQQKGTQIVVLMVPTTQPEDITSFSNRVGNAWKIGRKDVGDGVLLIVAKDDRKVRIEVAKTLEGAIPDLAARQVIESAITPNFKQGNYAAGLSAAADQLIARISGEALSEPNRESSGSSFGFDWADLAIFMFFAVPIAGGIARSIFGRKLGSLLVGGGVGVLAMLVTASLVVAGLAAVAALVVTLMFGSGIAASSGSRRSGGSSGWGGGFGGGGGSFGGGGGGGFSSGGGGDFGGGGASGDW